MCAYVMPSFVGSLQLEDVSREGDCRHVGVSVEEYNLGVGINSLEEVCGMKFSKILKKFCRRLCV